MVYNKVLTNNQYRSYEIEFPKALIPTYDFLQMKLLEILNNRYYYDQFNNFPIHNDDGSLIHKGTFWKIGRSLFPENYFDTWNLGGNAWYFRMLLDTIWRSLTSLDEKRQIYAILKRHDFKATKALRKDLCDAKLFPSNKELKNLIASRKYPNLSKDLTFIMDFSVSSSSTLKTVAENHYQLRVDKDTWCDYKILTPLSLRLELTGKLTKPSFRRKASGRYHGMCSYEVKPIDMGLEDNILGVDLGFVKLFSAVVLKPDNSLSREFNNSERLQALYDKLTRVYEAERRLYNRIRKSRATTQHIYTKNIRRCVELENLKTKIQNTKKTLMEELAAETISLALREKCNIIKVNPAFTSQRHPITKEKGVLRGRNLVFSDGKTYDRDYLASINIALSPCGKKHSERVIETLGPKKKRKRFTPKTSNKKMKQQRLLKSKIKQSFNQSGVREIVTYFHKANELSLNYAIVLGYDSVMSNYRYRLPILTHKYYLDPQ